MAHVTPPPPSPAPPTCSFASDNAAGASPEVIDAIAAANAGPALAYGDDPWTQRAEADLRDLFGSEVEVLLAFGGTGANIVGLASLLQPWQSVITVDSAHVVVDECGGPARFTGSTFTAVPHVEGKLTPESLQARIVGRGVEHRVQPRMVTISQVTEMGTVYAPEEIGALAEVCRRHELLLHVDGARLANAVAASGVGVDAMLRDTGVDVVTFGFTKNGAAFGEAIVYLRPDLAEHARFVRKQAGQLVSKSRFVAAQISALLADDLWLRNAGHANAMAAELAARADAIHGVTVLHEPQANGVIAQIPWDRLDDLQRWSFFWPWDPARSAVRWMASFATTPDDVATFAAGIEEILAT